MTDEIKVPKQSTRNQYEIEEDYHTVKRFFKQKIEVDTIFADETRLAEVKEYALKQQDVKKNTLEAIKSGSIKDALGFN